MLNLLLGYFQLACEEFHTIMLFLFWAPNTSYKRTMGAFENYSWTCILMGKQFLIREYFLAAFIQVAASELKFAEEIPGHPIDPIELTLVATVWASIWVLLKPVSFTIST